MLYTKKKEKYNKKKVSKWIRNRIEVFFFYYFGGLNDKEIFFDEEGETKSSNDLKRKNDAYKSFKKKEKK